MIVHIVMFKFKEENKAAHIAKVERMLNELPDRIDGLLSMEVGIDFNGSERAMDMVLTSTFETVEVLKVYATHPAHLEVVDVIRETTIESRVVDYVR